MPLRHRHHWFAHLALLAALLLAGMPTLGRLQQALHAAVDAPMVALCTLRGLEHVPLDALTAHSGKPSTVDHGSPEGGHPQHAQDDCTYCPLLAGLLVPSLATTGLPWAPVPSDGTRRPATTLPSAPSIPGLGSRGPPALSAVLR